MPNRFWKDTPQIPRAPNGIGNSIQQNSAANNPDIFCESQGSGYRLPSVHEYETDALAITNPGYPSAPQSPGHWSAYEDNDVTGTRKASTAVNARIVSGGLSNEWGDLTKYGNGWNSEPAYPANYWTTETSHNWGNAHISTTYGRNVGYGRIYFNVQTMVGYGTATGGIDERANPTTFNSTNALDYVLVACVRDLVPTPATPVPGKS